MMFVGAQFYCAPGAMNRAPTIKVIMFITLEGIDGCGKTTQAEMLVGWLRGRGHKVLHTREPGGTEIGRKIRAILLDPENKKITGLTELMLYSADRAQHLAEIIEPALKEGCVVVCDRFSDATEAYQGHARGLRLETIEMLTRIATAGRKPDLTLLLDIPADKALSRAKAREEDGDGKEARFEQESLRFHEKVREGYLKIAAREPGRVKVIDATGSPEEVQARILEFLDFRLRGNDGQQ